MDKIAKVPHLREELDWLDQTYGVEKEGFFHQEHWQLLVAIHAERAEHGQAGG